MKGFRRLFEESRRFYLCLLAIIVVFILADCMLICHDREVSLTKSGMEQMVQTTLAEENGVSIVENQYLSLEDIAKERGTELFGLFVVMLGVMGMLFAREIAFTDVRTQEFRNTWPIKNWVRELYDYIAMLVVIVSGFVLETIILLLVQIRYNTLLVDVLAQQGITSKVTDEMSASNQYLLISMVCYIIAIVASYTWISLGMSLAKNPIAGALFSLVVRYILQLVWTCFAWSAVARLTSDVNSTQQIYYYNDFADLIEEIGCVLLIHQEFFYGVDVRSGIIGGCGDGFRVSHWMFAQVVICILLIVCLVISAKKKDLSKGKLLYFPVLGYPLGILVGLGAFLISWEWFWWDANGLEIAISFILGFGAAIGTCLLCQPFSRSKSLRLEVK